MKIFLTGENKDKKGTSRRRFGQYASNMRKRYLPFGPGTPSFSPGTAAPGKISSSLPQMAWLWLCPRKGAFSRAKRAERKEKRKKKKKKTDRNAREKNGKKMGFGAYRRHTVRISFPEQMFSLFLLTDRRFTRTMEEKDSSNLIKIQKMCREGIL